jgi:CRISPR system Cascade subunit CasA
VNLLADLILPYVDGRNVADHSDLPTLLAAYSRDAVLDLPFLRPHQHAPWHSFLAQLAAIALHRGGLDEIPGDHETWRELLRGLTAKWGNDDPWRLVVEDVTRPAFMQPPVPKSMADPHKISIETPDDLDVLVTAKNHGVKQGLVADATPAAWIAALVLLQTTVGVFGAGNYGVVRMNGGYATRPFTGLVPKGGAGAHWRRDVEVMLRRRDWFFERIDEFADEGGAALLWCLPWDGERGLALTELDPWFIEVCRRVRLYRDPDGGLIARSIGSKGNRVDAKKQRGNLGDPWIPISRNVNSPAFNEKPTYESMSEVLLQPKHWISPLLLQWHEGIDQIPSLSRFDVVVRGDGKTKGYYIREVPIDSARRRAFLFDASERDETAKLAKQMIEDAGNLQNRVLKVPLLTLLQAGAAEVDFGDRTATRWVKQWLDASDRQVDEHFFEQLFIRAESGSTETWGRFLKRTAEAVFHDAVRTAPIAGARNLKAQAVAEQRLGALFWKTLGGLLPEREKETVDVK